MTEKKTFYISTTLPYVNAKPHVGHALEFVRADVIARFAAISGWEVFLNTGTDEHGAKIHKKAIEEGVPVQEYVDRYAENFKELAGLVGMARNVSGITFNFIRTTNENHIRSAQSFWKLCNDNGHIYKKPYKTKYCIGCELEKTESELVNGKCPIHPSMEIELIEEENYFFKASEFSKALLSHFKENPTFVVPQSRHNEMVAFLERGLEDFSISRLREKMPWGVPVPGDENQVMYVWFDALVNYISAIGWPEDLETFNKWWPMTQYCGKDNTRQQSVMWQSMLLAAGLPLSKQIVVNGFVTGEGGVKMSKSLGNVIDPVDIIREYGTDAFRYYVLREIQPFEDSPFTVQKFKDAYNGNLVNGLGNLVSRVMKMVVSYDVDISGSYKKSEKFLTADAVESFDLKKAMDAIFALVKESDEYVQSNEPFKTIKTDPEKAHKDIQFLVGKLYTIASELEPFMPETSAKIKDCIENKKSPEVPLFPRKD